MSATKKATATRTTKKPRAKKPDTKPILPLRPVEPGWYARWINILVPPMPSAATVRPGRLGRLS